MISEQKNLKDNDHFTPTEELIKAFQATKDEEDTYFIRSINAAKSLFSYSSENFNYVKNNLGNVINYFMLLGALEHWYSSLELFNEVPLLKQKLAPLYKQILRKTIEKHQILRFDNKKEIESILADCRRARKLVNNKDLNGLIHEYLPLSSDFISNAEFDERLKKYKAFLSEIN